MYHADGLPAGSHGVRRQVADPAAPPAGDPFRLPDGLAKHVVRGQGGQGLATQHEGLQAGSGKKAA